MHRCFGCGAFGLQQRALHGQQGLDAGLVGGDHVLEGKEDTGGWDDKVNDGVVG